MMRSYDIKTVKSKQVDTPNHSESGKLKGRNKLGYHDRKWILALVVDWLGEAWRS